MIAAVGACFAPPLQAQVELLGEAIDAVQTDHTKPEAWSALGTRFRAASASWSERAEWSDAERILFVDAALCLTDPESLFEFEPKEQGAVLLRAADLALEFHIDAFGSEPEELVSGELIGRGEYEVAAQRLRQAIEHFPPNAKSPLRLYRWLAVAECFLGQLGAAEKTLERGFELCRARETAGTLDVVERGLLESARVLWLTQLGLTDHAARALERERQDLANADDESARFVLIGDQNMLDIATDLNERAIERSRDALRGEVSLPNRILVSLSLTRALVEASRTDPTRVEEALSEARAAFDAVDEVSRSRIELSLSLAELELMRGGRTAARERLRSLAQFEPLPVNDAARAVTLNSRLARAEVNNRAELDACRRDIATTFERLIDEWASAPERVDGLGYQRFAERRDLFCELVALERALHGDEAAAEAAIRTLISTQELGSLHRRLAVPAGLSFEQVRAALCTDRRGVLVIVQGDRESFAITFDSKSARVFLLPPWHAWRALQRQWVALLTREPADEQERRQRRRSIPALGAQLADRILPAELVAQLDQWDELAIVGWDWFGYLPFESLPFGERDFGRRFAMCYLPSLTVASAIATRAPRRAQGLSVIATPTTPAAASEHGWDWAELSWSPARERRLAEQWSRLQVRTGERATLASLRELCTDDTAVLEITAHGFYDGSAVPPAGFGLASDASHDGLVRSSDLQDFRAPSFVVLAVCGAARGPARAGDDGIGNLGGAFLGARADSVAFSHADLRQDSAERFVALVYESMLDKNSSPAAALRDARLALDEADPFDRDLIHLAGFGFHPLHIAARTEDSRANNRLVVALAAALSIAVGAWLALRRRSKSAA